MLKNQQRVFVPVVSDYLRTVSYQDGYVEQIQLPQYEMIAVLERIIEDQAGEHVGDFVRQNRGAWSP